MVWQKIRLEAKALKVTAACCPLRHDNLSQNREGQPKQNRTSMKQPLTFRHTSFLFTTLQATPSVTRKAGHRQARQTHRDERRPKGSGVGFVSDKQPQGDLPLGDTFTYLVHPFTLR